jgi:serine/threonine protein kinase
VEIGAGSFGKVSVVKKKYKNEKNNNKEEYYAMKEIDMKKKINSNYDYIQMEINACGVCKHPNIVKYIDHYYDERNECVCLVLELCEYGSLSQFSKIFQEHNPYVRIPEEVFILFFIYLFIY